MTKIVHVVDYGAGNILSVSRALEKIGFETALADSPETARVADRLLLPGVGAFRDGMFELGRRGLDDAVREFSRTERPLVGICLGMQMLMSESVEFGAHGGLDLIPGRVRPIPNAGIDGERHKVPFVGWARLRGAAAPKALNANTLMRPALSGAEVYLVHSFYCVADDPFHCLATYEYDGLPITAAVRRGNILGVQFHPEKSGPVGLSILSALLDPDQLDP